MLAFEEFNTRMDLKFRDEYGALQTTPPGGMLLTPIEELMNFLRGFKASVSDLRRHAGRLSELTEAMFETQCAPAIQRALDADHSGYVAPLSTAMLIFGVLNPVQFEQLYWPHLKRVIDAAVVQGKHLFIFCEGPLLRFAEFFEEVPKGTVLMHISIDDIFEVRRRLPNLALAGGMQSGLVANGSEEQCIAHARRLIDELGPGYVLSSDMILSYPHDARREDLLAVNRFALDYQP
jgi:hypothetical protein